MGQERLDKLLAAAVEAATRRPEWQDGDELCVILADGESTVLSTQGFSTNSLIQMLEFHAGKLRQARTSELQPHTPA